MKLLNNIINYIFPFRCNVCSNLTDSSEGICSACWPKFNFITKPYCYICCEKFQVNLGEDSICSNCIASKPKVDIVRSLLEFSPETKSIIHKFKYNDKTSLGKLFAKLLYNRFEQEIKDVDLIVPVPMHKLKRIFRGYNPPQILASELAKQLNIVMIPELLVKTKLTKNQVGLTRQQRAKNLAKSFEIGKRFDIRGKVILLVDDVLTTGATSNECSKILKKSGASIVKLVTIAKVALR